MTKWIGLCVHLLVMLVTISGCAQAAVPTEVGLSDQETSVTDEFSGEPSETEETDTAVPDKPEVKMTEEPDAETVDQKAITTPEGEEEILTDPLQRKLVALAMQDLSDKLVVEQHQIQMVSIESITWPDASLGCPKPGMFYAQILSPGYRVILIVDGETYNYHADTQGEFFLCDIENMPRIRGTPIWRSPDRR